MEHMRCKKDGYTCACIPWTTREREKEEGSKDEKKKKKEKRDDVCGIHLIQVLCLSILLG